MKKEIDLTKEPWHGEPDELVWTDAATGYVCAIRRNDMTYCLNGYVFVPKDHPLHGMHGSDDLPESLSGIEHDIAEAKVGKRGMIDVFFYAATGKAHVSTLFDVHGSITWSGPLWWRDDEREWAFGFDTAHAYDRQPGLEAQYRGIAAKLRKQGEQDKAALFDDISRGLTPAVYRTFEYVKGEVESLAKQLHAVAEYARVVATEDDEARRAVFDILTTLRRDRQ